MYQWTITKDHLADQLRDETGTVGPHDATMTSRKIAAHPDGKKFRMFDSDGERYYDGVLIGGDGFEPLDDFGKPNAGASEIRFLENGKWVQL